MGLIQDLLDDVALSIVDDVCGAIGLGGFHTNWAGTYGKQTGGSPQGSASHGHEAHRADSNNTDSVAELNVRQLYPVETGGDHIAEHHGGRRVQLLRQPGEVGVCLIDVEIFRENAVLEVGELPSGQHTARVHGISGLSFQAAPIRCNGRDNDPVAGLQGLHQAAYFHDFAHRFVAQNHVSPFADGAFPDGMDVRGAGGDGQRTHNGIQRPTGGDLLLNPAGLADS